MDKLKWCLKKGGIELVEPNQNLMIAYFRKASRAIKAMRHEKDNPEWEITAGYYAMYFSVYALCLRMGIKTDIHSCTIEIARVFLKDLISPDSIKILEDAKEIRNQVQYYIIGNEEIMNYRKGIEKAYDFHIHCRTIADRITQELIDKIRKSLENIQNQRL